MEVDAAADIRYRNFAGWNHSAIVNTAKMGYFSSDRTIRECAERIWDIWPRKREGAEGE